MNIAAEKKAIIKRFDEVQDVYLIKAIKNILDFGLNNQKSTDAISKEEKGFHEYDSKWWDKVEQDASASIERGMKEAREGKGVPHEEVMKKYKKWQSM